MHKMRESIMCNTDKKKGADGRYGSFEIGTNLAIYIRQQRRDTSGVPRTDFREHVSLLFNI